MGKLETQQHWAQKEDKQKKTHNTKTKQMSEQHVQYTVINIWKVRIKTILQYNSVMIVYIILFSFSTDRMIHVIYLVWIRTMIFSLYEVCIKSIKKK